MFKSSSNCDDKKCVFSLNDTDKCICKTTNHGSWSFGVKFYKENYIILDESNSIKDNSNLDDYYLSRDHYTFFKENSLTVNNNEIKYYDKCDCRYCIYAKNKNLNIFEECFCCKARLYLPNHPWEKEFVRCSDCNSILCDNCYIQGRYNDYEEGTFCYGCRRFTMHKNECYFFGGNGDRYEDWQNASWYY